MVKTMTTKAKSTTTYPVISGNPAVQSHYETMRRNGESHSIAEMCATRFAPKMHGSERALLEGLTENHRISRMPEDQLDLRIAQARAAGVNTQGKVYADELARPGMTNDPEAWISGRDDFERVCRKNGWGCKKLGIKAAQYQPEKKAPRLAEPLVREMMGRKLESMDPGERQKTDLRELREQVIEDHGATAEVIATT